MEKQVFDFIVAKLTENPTELVDIVGAYNQEHSAELEEVETAHSFLEAIQKTNRVIDWGKKVEFDIECLEEYEPIEKALSFDTTGADHSEYIKKVMDDDGLNPWLWCCVKITAEIGGLKGSAILGQCAYESEEAFKVGGYWEQMQDEAFDDLKQKVEALLKALGV